MDKNIDGNEYWVIRPAIYENDESSYRIFDDDNICRPYKISKIPYSIGSYTTEKYPYSSIIDTSIDFFETEELAFKAYIKALEEKIVACNEEIDFAKERLGVK